MKTIVTGVMFAGLIIVAGCAQTPQQSSSSGPNGGDLVSIQNGKGYAELLANSDTGEVMVHTWDKDLKNSLPVEKAPITVGSDDKSVELTPHPTDRDPAGYCSRFYGHADWVKGGRMRNGWMHGGGVGEHRTFEWNHCWQGGRMHGPMWEEMGKHRRMGPGHHGGMER